MVTLTIDHPATIFDMAELGRATTAMHWAVVKEMWSGGDSWAVRDGERLVALAGLYPIDGGAEAWFNACPEAGAYMLQIVRQIRLTLVSGRYPEIVVLCTSRAGSRIARLCGLHFVETVENGEIWHARFARRQQRFQACETAGGTKPASYAGGTVSAAG